MSRMIADRFFPILMSGYIVSIAIAARVPAAFGLHVVVEVVVE